jgi:taurine dioxygenase
MNIDQATLNHHSSRSGDGTMQKQYEHIVVSPLRGALGARVTGLDIAAIDGGPQEAAIVAELHDAWTDHLVLFFPHINLTPARQVMLAGKFGSNLAATTETGGDYRNAASLADEGFKELLLIKSEAKRSTNVWHTDVTFVETPPIGSLFCMETPAEGGGGDTMWANQYATYESLSAPVKEMISELTASHGRPPITGTAVHPVVKVHPVSGRTYLNVNRGWTNAVRRLSTIEAKHVLEMLIEVSERPEFQIRWQWAAGDAALWDNRCTMHYAVDDYGTEFRRARRATIYA